jgi:5-methylcytosine-specific restriction endonuclease McrA
LETEDDVFRAIEKILCLEPKRWEWISQYQTEELRCNVFGHICPIFFSAESFTETKEGRNTTRTIPRSVMLKVVRRDGQVCAVCRKNVLDDEIEFDHIIPFSRGGSSSQENLRVLCRDCNRKKSDTLRELLAEDMLRKTDSD